MFHRTDPAYISEIVARRLFVSLTSETAKGSSSSNKKYVSLYTATTCFLSAKLLSGLHVLVQKQEARRSSRSSSNSTDRPHIPIKYIARVFISVLSSLPRLKFILVLLAKRTKLGDRRTFVCDLLMTAAIYNNECLLYNEA